MEDTEASARLELYLNFGGNINGSFYPLDNSVLAAYLPRHINLEVDISTFSFIISTGQLTARRPPTPTLVTLVYSEADIMTLL